MNKFDKMTTFGERIGDLLKEKHKTAKEAAVDLKVSEPTFSKWRTSEYKPDSPNSSAPSIDSLIKLADYFDVSIDFLLGCSSFKRRMDDEPSKKDVKSVAQYVQLSEESVSKLHSNDDFSLIILIDFLLKTPELLEKILEYFVYQEGCCEESEVLKCIIIMLSRFKQNFFDYIKFDQDTINDLYDIMVLKSISSPELENTAYTLSLDARLKRAYLYGYYCDSFLDLQKKYTEIKDAAFKDYDDPDSLFILKFTEKKRKTWQQFFENCYRFPIGKRIINQALQNRPKEEESPDE